MYLLTYIYNDKEYIGFLDEEQKGIIPSSKVFSELNIDNPKDMSELIDIFENAGAENIKNVLCSCKPEISLEQVKICAPIPYPRRNVFCLGKNYLDHVHEVKGLKNVNADIPEKPIYFSKVAYPAIGHEDFIDSHPHIVTSLDYEAELAVIIGKKCKNVSKEEAGDVIFGYTICNDISARDLQQDHMQWHKGKSVDTFTPMGPYIAHKSNIAFPPCLEIKCYVNDELRQNSNTNQLIFDIPAIISDLSSCITLYPGDIILTGTPAGVGAGFNPPNYLKQGDVIKCYVENIGELSNTVK